VARAWGDEGLVGGRRPFDFIDDTDALPLQFADFSPDVGDVEGEMVHPLAFFLEELVQE
jgi:hypothetical protein